MRKLHLPVLLCIISASQQISGREIDGFDVPDSVTVQGSSDALVLNGAGMRKKFFMDIYVGTLYLAEKNSDEYAIFSDSGPAVVDMHIVYSEIGKDKIIDGWNDGLQANIGREELELLGPSLEEFNKLFKSVHKGDVIRIAYLPDKGTEVRINGEWRGMVEGNDFFRALLKVWLGSRPISKSLKQEMLGLK
jgi:hypothetical protein